MGVLYSINVIGFEIILLFKDYLELNKKQKEIIKTTAEYNGYIAESDENESKTIKDRNLEIIEDIEDLIKEYDKEEAERKKQEKIEQEDRKKQEDIEDERNRWLESPEGLFYLQEQEKLKLEKERIRQERRMQEKERERQRKIKKCLWCGSEHSYTGKFCCKSCETKFKNSR